MKGAIITGKFKMRKGQVLHVGIGQKGTGSYGCGAGGTFVISKKCDGTFAPLVVAGGAGGDYKQKKHVNCNAQLKEYGNAAPGGEHNMNIGSSGISGDSSHYNGGAGYLTDPPGATDNYPKCFTSGLTGGYRLFF